MLTSTDRKAIAEARKLAAAIDTEALREVYRFMGGTGDYPVQADLFAALLGRAGALAAELAGMAERRDETITELQAHIAELQAQLAIERDGYQVRGGAR